MMIWTASSFLAVRQLNASIEDIELYEVIEIQNPQESLEYRLITKIIERIRDRAVSIARNVQRMNSGVNPDDSIFRMAELSRKVFESSIDSLVQEELQIINKIVVEAKKVSQF